MAGGRCYGRGVTWTTTIHVHNLRRLLAESMPEFEGQPGALQQGIRLTARESRRRLSLRSLVAWIGEDGLLDERAVSTMLKRHFGR